MSGARALRWGFVALALMAAAWTVALTAPGRWDQLAWLPAITAMAITVRVRRQL